MCRIFSTTMGSCASVPRSRDSGRTLCTVWDQSLQHLERSKPAPWRCLNVHARFQWNETCRIHLLLYVHELYERLLHALQVHVFQESWIDWDDAFEDLLHRLPTNRTKKGECTPVLYGRTTDPKRRGRRYLDRLVWIEHVVQQRRYTSVSWMPHCRLVMGMMKRIPCVSYSTILCQHQV